VDNSGTHKTSVVKGGTGAWILSGTNTNTGTTTVNAGTLQLAKQVSLYNNTTASWTAANINVKSGGTLAFNVGGTGEFTTGDFTTLLTNLAASSSATNGMNAGSNFGFDTTNASGGTFTIANVIANSTGTSGGARGLTKLGTGTLILNNTNTYTGATTVSTGTLVVNGSISTSSLTTVATGATIGGSGTIGALTVSSGGFINPGNSPGILNVSGNYTQTGLYTAEITGLTAGTEHDQINVTGTVDITGGSLTASFTAGTYAANDLIFILLNDGADAITGTYSGLAQGATVTSYGGFNWNISYVANSGGSPSFTGGNDIALMAEAIPEPKTALLGVLGLLLLLRRRRK
jgi:autotransporter-associated beta strand protein